MKTTRLLWCSALGLLVAGASGLASSSTQQATGKAKRVTKQVEASPPAQQPATAAASRIHRVPYRMSETLHLIVRAKLNGKGPFNFIVDTGAPAMFVTTATAKEAAAEKDANGWSTFARMELEGGAVITNARARAEDIFQIRGMNSLGLPGVRLDGVLGYNILARYRMEFDLAKSTMNWTELEFDPALPEPLRGDGAGGAPPELEMVGNLMQVFGGMFRRQEAPAIEPRGCLGIEIVVRDGSVFIQSVLSKSPAESAGLKPGDQLLKFADTTIRNASELMAAAAAAGPNDQVRIAVKRAGEVLDVTATLGRGI